MDRPRLWKRVCSSYAGNDQAIVHDEFCPNDKFCKYCGGQNPYWDDSPPRTNISSIPTVPSRTNISSIPAVPSRTTEPTSVSRSRQSGYPSIQSAEETHRTNTHSPSTIQGQFTHREEVTAAKRGTITASTKRNLSSVKWKIEISLFIRTYEEDNSMSIVQLG